ncbi:MAG: hypothetical protein ABL861_01120, partial [Nitrosomonas sp.]
AAILMMTSFLLVNGLRITMMCQDVNVEGLEAYISSRRINQIMLAGTGLFCLLLNPRNAGLALTVVMLS